MSAAPAEPSGQPPAAAPPRPPSILRRVWDIILGQWMLIAMGFLVLLAWLFPSVGKRGGHIAAQWTVTWGAVILIFLISGLSLPFNKLVTRARNIRMHLQVQIASFLISSAVFYGIACAAATNDNIYVPILVGLIATGCLPTGISSNVVMTRMAKGDEPATMVEVSLGNFLGPFITPLLINKLYLPSTAKFRAWLPDDAIHNLPSLYRRVMMQMGLTVFVPLAVGQVIRAIWPKQVQWTMAKFKLAKVGSLCLLALIWSTFCTAFASKALERINSPTIIFLIFVNFGLSIGMTVMAFYLARPPKALNRLSPVLFHRASKEETASVVFLIPSKTQALGIPLVAAMYASETDEMRALIQVPMILFNAIQILCGQLCVPHFRHWIEKKKVDDEESGPEADVQELGSVSERTVETGVPDSDDKVLDKSETDKVADIPATHHETPARQR